MLFRSKRRKSVSVSTFLLFFLDAFRTRSANSFKIQIAVEKCLSEQRNDGIEDIYWELAGSGNHGQTSQLMLVGMMVDRAEVRVQDGFVDLTLYKELRE